jgi:hypothetical protein
MEPLDSHLWAPPPPAISRTPALRALLLAEQAGDASELASLPFVREQSVGGGTAHEVIGRADVSMASAVLEERGHWGRAVQPATTRCGRCGLPPTGPVLLFPCGHLFHTSCLPEHACVQCMARPATPLPVTWELRTLSSS